MATVRSGGGDPSRCLALLWGSDLPSRARGPKPGLTVRGIARAAIELADSEGLDALSMRRVAERLGVGTMSLYTYVPGKAELVDVAGAARSAINALDVERSSGIDDAAWWAATGPWLAKVLDPGRYPVASRVGTTGEYYQAVSDPDHAFEFGLQRVLDGIEALVQQRGPHRDPV